MYGEPRKGTEAYLVKQEAEKRQKIAKEKGLDKLLINVYQDCLKYSPTWIKNHNNKWVYPLISEAKEIKEKKYNGIEFKIENKNYRITRGDSWIPDFRDNHETWYEMVLFLNGKKVFAVTEAETSDEYSDYHRPISVKAYVNEDWVDDFKKIIAHKDNMSKQSEIEFAEDPKRTHTLMEDFGIDEIPAKISAPQPHKEVLLASKKPFWKRWWFWVVIVYLFLVLTSN